MNLTGQIFSAIAAILMIIAIQMKEKEKLLILYAIGLLAFSFSFFLLDGLSGSVVCFIMGVQMLITYQYTKRKQETPKLVMYVCLLLALISGVMAYKNIYSILPIVCSIIQTAIALENDMKKLRILRFTILGCWLLYEVIICAYAAIISDTFGIISTLIAIFRFDILKRSK